MTCRNLKSMSHVGSCLKGQQRSASTGNTWVAPPYSKSHIMKPSRTLVHLQWPFVLLVSERWRPSRAGRKSVNTSSRLNPLTKRQDHGINLRQSSLPIFKHFSNALSLLVEASVHVQPAQLRNCHQAAGIDSYLQPRA